MHSHLGGWQQHREEERNPHSPTYWYAEILQCYSERREQGGCGAQRNRACSRPATWDEVREGAIAGLNRHVSQSEEQWGTEEHPLNLQHRVWADCIQDAAVNTHPHPLFVLTLTNVRAACNLEQKEPSTVSGPLQNKPVTAWHGS